MLSEREREELLESFILETHVEPRDYQRHAVGHDP